MRRHRRLAGAAALAAALAVAPLATAPGAATPAATAPDTYVTAWDAVTSQALAAAAANPADGHTVYAYESIAVYDAVTAIRPGFQPFLVRAHTRRGTSAAAAVAAAARAVLVHYLPAQAARVIEPAYTASLGTIPDGRAKAEGVALGERVAGALISERQDDGFRASVPYVPPDPAAPGVWIPTAPTPAVGTYLARMRPFALASADQFRPGGPPALHSRRWARDYNEVKSLGSIDSTTRTEAQTLAARFWAEPPVQQAHGAFRRLVDERRLDVYAAARLLAMVSVTIADAQIACYEAKYHYAFWRPVTAIRAGDTDGNDATLADPTWSPLLPATPNHPDYPSAHSCVTPAAGLAIARFLGSRHIDLTVPSLTGLGDRSFATVRDLTLEVTNARIWGGIHFRSAVEDGVVIARRTADEVLAHAFRRSEGCHTRSH